MSRFWVVLKLSRWEEMETNIGLPLRHQMEDNSIGYLPVYESREEAETEAGDKGKVMMIRPIEKERT